MVDTPVAVIPAPAPAQQGSTMRKFLAERGVIMMRENRTITTVATLYGADIEVGGQILVIVKGLNRQVMAGVKLEREDTDHQLGSAAFLDSDEIDECLGAIDFIVTSADQMAHDRRDYTEVTYSSKDDVTVGFYQDGTNQQGFLRLGAGSSTAFMSITTLQALRVAIFDARTHADSRRTAWDSR